MPARVFLSAFCNAPNRCRRACSSTWLTSRLTWHAVCSPMRVCASCTRNTAAALFKQRLKCLHPLRYWGMLFRLRLDVHWIMSILDLVCFLGHYLVKYLSFWFMLKLQWGITGRKKNYLVPVSDRPCQFICEANLFYALEESSQAMLQGHSKIIVIVTSTDWYLLCLLTSRSKNITCTTE